MEIKYIYLLALISILIVGYFYVDEKSESTHSSRTISTRDYQATAIYFTQSDTQGRLQSTLSASHLAHYVQDDRSELHDIHAALYENNQIRSEFKSKMASSQTQDAQQILMLSDQVALTDFQNHTPMSLTTDKLTANLTQKTISGTTPLLITSGNSRLTASAVQGNLAEGIYQLNTIKAQFQPSQLTSFP